MMSILRKRFSPTLSIKDECKNDSGNILTAIKIESPLKYIKEYREHVKPIVNEDNEIIRLVLEALILYYSWDKDFLEVGLNGLPKVEDLTTVDEISAREVLIECIIKSMYDVDLFHPELRIICNNVNSVSVVNVYRSMILLSINTSNNILH